MKKKKKILTFISKFKSIRSAMVFSFSFLIVAALLVFLLLSLNYTKETVLDNSISYTSKLVGQMNYDIDSYIDYMTNISSVMANSEDVQNYLFEEHQGAVRAEEKSRILSQFKTIISSRNDIANIAALSKDGKSLINTGNETLNEYVKVEQLDWFQSAIKSDTGLTLSSSHVQNAVKSSYQWVITLSRALENKKTGERAGVFFIDLNYTAISNLCNNNKIGNKGYIFILDEKGNIIYHPQQQLMYGGLKTESIDDIMSCEEEYLIKEEKGDTKIYTMSRSEKTGWTVVGMAYTSELLKNNKQTQILYVLVAVILLGIAVFFANVITKGITKPIEELRDSMAKVEHGEFDKANVEITTQNEIGGLSKSFNVMTERIQTLMEENIYEQKEKRKSELKALQSQINPHFLYNTLDSIIWMAEGRKNEEVVLMTAALAKLLRQSISNENEIVTMEQEIDYVKSYLTIQKMRYKDKLEYEIVVEPAVKTVPTIKLILQPVVENAIYHGLKYKESIGFLSIHAYVKEEKAIVEIMDDGAGMSQETLSHIAEKHKVNYTSNGVGIYNVQKRLQLCYGKEYGIVYTSELGVGTTAVITIPMNGGARNETT